MISGDESLAESNPFRYRGYYQDSESGFFYLQSRYYDSIVGRFLNADTQLNTEQGIIGSNLVTYCLNNPINMIDLDGRSAAAIAVSGPTFAAFCAWLSTIGSANFWNPLGWIILGVLAAGVVTWAAVTIYNSWKTSSSSRTKTLPDIKVKLPPVLSKVYYLAYVNDKGELIKYGQLMSFVAALAMMGITGAANVLTKRYRYNTNKSSTAQRTLERLSKMYGIYTHDKAYAKALAVVLGNNSKPEVHGQVCMDIIMMLHIHSTFGMVVKLVIRRMNMFVQLFTIYSYFESIIEPSLNYFNIINYQIYSQSEKQNLLNSSVSKESDFILIPQIDRSEIVNMYISTLPKINFKHKKQLINNFHKFHVFLEDNNLYESWKCYEENKLLGFCENWCIENNIKYTKKVNNENCKK